MKNRNQIKEEFILYRLPEKHTWREFGFKGKSQESGPSELRPNGRSSLFVLIFLNLYRGMADIQKIVLI